MWAVQWDGVVIGEYPHYCDAADALTALPGSGPDDARIVTVMPDAEHELRIRLAPLKRLRAEQIRAARRDRARTKYGM